MTTSLTHSLSLRPVGRQGLLRLTVTAYMLSLVIGPAWRSALAQEAAKLRDSLQTISAERQAEQTRAARIFLNNQLPLATRLGAVDRIPSFTLRQHSAEALRLAFDRTAAPRLRVAAFKLAGAALLEDVQAHNRLGTLIGQSDTPSPVRRAAMGQLQLLRVARPSKENEELMRKLLDHPLVEVRRLAISNLALAGDSAARNSLRAGLEDSATALFPSDVALALLSAHPNADLGDIARRYLTGRSSPETKRLAIRLAALSDSGRGDVARVLRDRASPTDLRLVGAQALAANDLAQFRKLSEPIATDENETESLRVAIIEILNLRGPEPGSRDADRTEKVMEGLSTKSSSQPVREAAARYLEERQ